MNESTYKLNITAWAEADRPREKLLLHGRRHLSDAELIAILIGSGNKEETAVDLSKRMLSKYNNDLDTFSTLGFKELSEFKGIGEAKAITIIAALELGRRRKDYKQDEKSYVKSSKDAYQIIKSQLEDLYHEEFWLILLARNNRVISRQCISKGGQSATVVDAKVIFRVALEHQSNSIILVHNHPSGSLKPSDEDLRITKKLVELGNMMDLQILDHLIIGNQEFFSFADNALL